MTITVSTDPIVAYASLAKYLVVNSPEIAKIKIADAKENRRERKYERMIRRSQRHIGPYVR